MYSRENRAKNLEYYREYDRSRGNRQTAKDVREYRKNNRNKYKAHNTINNAIRDGKLEKPEACEECNKPGKIHGHHDDYDKPLDVRWLCPACHHQWHSINGEAKNAS